jgi:predicted deacylase
MDYTEFYYNINIPKIFLDIKNQTLNTKKTYNIPLLIDNNLTTIDIIVITGKSVGPTTTLISGIHGDELGGISINKLIYSKIENLNFSGKLIFIPEFNPIGMNKFSRYMYDTDLNRVFTEENFNNIVINNFNKNNYYILIFLEIFRCLSQISDLILDFHTNNPKLEIASHIRWDHSNKNIKDIIQYTSFNNLNCTAPKGSIRGWCNERNVNYIIIETGQGLSMNNFEEAKIIKNIVNILVYCNSLQHYSYIVHPGKNWTELIPIWSPIEGIVKHTKVPVKLGQRVQEGDVIAEITNISSGKTLKIEAPCAGEIAEIFVHNNIKADYPLLFSIAK